MDASMAYKIFLNIIPLLFAVIAHEYMHGYVAERFGDPTARIMGRLTFNPLKHIDPVGSVILPFVLFITHSPVMFGWAKPVPVNFFALRNPKRDMVLVSLAGPGSNFVIAFLCGILYRVMWPLTQGDLPVLLPVALLLVYSIIINLFLCFFNLIPIPPLDGSKILAGLLPGRLSAKYLQLERYGIIIFISVILVLQLINFPIVNRIILFPVVFFATIFAGPNIHSMF